MIKNQRNKEGNQHGFWKEYWCSIKGELMYKGNFKNGEQHGYWEYYYSLSPKIKRHDVLKQFYI